MPALKFIDLFAGCGGLSLGLSYAGFQGQFAIERDRMAFATFSENFLGNRITPVRKFDWPVDWLEPRAWTIDDLLAEHRPRLLALRGSIDLLAGGPPCQGFSFAGKRIASDPRNMLFEKYVEVVDIIRPSAIVLENVPGMMVAHACNTESCGTGVDSFYQKLKAHLVAIGYAVHGEIVDASLFGVPQRRSRLIVVGIQNPMAQMLQGGVLRVFNLLKANRRAHLERHGLAETVCARDAISDLLTDRGALIPCTDPDSPPGFTEAWHPGPLTHFQKLLHKDCHNPMDSMRLARHRPEVRERFEHILKECARGVAINDSTRQRLGIKKHRTHPMAPHKLAPTITTLPDDVLHYAEPRILTVRESARLQTFPDWFRFKGKFTTGGALRTKECPRYTQVGNAVPPFLGWAIGLAIRTALAEVACMQRQEQPDNRNLIAA
jgi:DNA (cytosine-5)-methyltransferase 1